jgi:hypothetical protein
MRRSNSRVALAACLGGGAFAFMTILGERTPETMLAIAVASVAASVMVLVVERPVVAVGILFVLASLSGFVATLPIGRVRLEQPAIIAALITLTLTRGWPRRSEVRPVLPILAAFAVYLVVLTVASALNAPKPVVSARLIVWTVLSMAGGVVAFVLLLRPARERVEAWFTGTGIAHAVVGLAIAAAFLFFGPHGIPGMQTSPGEVPKVAGLAFEANLFASMLGSIAPFALDRFRSRPTLATAIPLVILVVGVGLGVTRGAYIGLGVGLLVYLGIVAYRSPRPSEALAVVPVLAVALLLAPSIAAVSLPVERASERPGPSASISPGGSTFPGETATPRPTPSPGESTAPLPSPTPSADTFSYRTDRIPTALKDLATSPIIGLGAATYGQRHHLPNQSPAVPDYIGILALVALYESGIVGAAALALGFLLSFRLLFRRSRDLPGTAAAYTAALVALLVAYQATNALFFSINWIILGAGLAFAVRSERDVSTGSV